MKKIIVFFLVLAAVFRVEAQLGVRYDPSAQPTSGIQYFKPVGNLFVGDCIPFYHDGTYKTVELAETSITAVDGLEKKVRVQIIMKGDIIDVCVGSKRCIDDRLYEQKGTNLGFYAKHGTVDFSSIRIEPLATN